MFASDLESNGLLIYRYYCYDSSYVVVDAYMLSKTV